MSALAYTLAQATEVAPVSIDVLRRAVRATATHDADGVELFPQPLKAKRLGNGVNAKVVVLADDLKEWLEHLPDAS